MNLSKQLAKLNKRKLILETKQEINIGDKTELFNISREILKIHNKIQRNNNVFY